jgi:hypothetical protein
MDGGSIKRIVEATGLQLAGDPKALLDELQTADVAHSGARPAYEKVGRKRLALSPADWLMGQKLPEIYGRFFGEAPGRSRDKDGAPSGPCVRFIGASLREMQITKRDGTPYAAETIARAISESRKPRVRRGATRRK